MRHRLNEMRQRSPEPVELPHDQHIICADSVKRGFEARSLRRDTRHATIFEDLRAACFHQRVALKVKQLFLCRDAGIADFHGEILQ